MALKNVNCSIKKGEFVCVIGDVGSGKSSLLQALIGDMLPLNQNDFTLLKNENCNDLDVKRQINDCSKVEYGKNGEAESPIQVNQSVSYVQ
jgi:ABC-type cobalamin/Fe3+-siderophores transport system ATPase subunit